MVQCQHDFYHMCVISFDYTVLCRLFMAKTKCVHNIIWFCGQKVHHPCRRMETVWATFDQIVMKKLMLRYRLNRMEAMFHWYASVNCSLKTSTQNMIFRTCYFT